MFKLEGGSGRPALLRLAGWETAFGCLSAGISTRLGGVSEGPFCSLNGAFHVGDDPQRVLENRRRLCEAIGLPFDAWTCAEQVHGSRVAVVGEIDRGRGRMRRDDAIGEYDAMITKTPGVMLAAFFADCAPIWMFDPVGGSAGLAHAGWRGTVAGVAVKTLEAMVESFGARPENVRVAIGPAIGACCYTVNGSVAERVAALFDEIAEESENGAIFSDIMRRVSPDADVWRLDLKKLNRFLLIKAGILSGHIEISEWCTGCRTDLWYSHRREGGRTGRMTAWIALTDKTGGSGS
ncbi:MAG: hypothetical protein BLM47_01000 [Candidatus Reconcilbacillus cellulovorans]|uniref:Purine nucleoside phosphorylase n=1 Tax=Candidatus Reconcilbacillus cellulovorans TaxID=1906605 RepID=A0A2A6E444_9BACL|nr:MAG: hypothetical protein BLM47_01000 [Candidatus Reconcilbacillus cellulovorans]